MFEFFETFMGAQNQKNYQNNIKKFECNYWVHRIKLMLK